MRTTNPVFSRFTEAARQGGALTAGTAGQASDLYLHFAPYGGTNRRYFG